VEEQFESWADNIVEQKPYVSLSPHGLYSVLDMDGESAYSTNSKILAYDYLKKNFDQLAGITIEPPIEENTDQPMIIDGKEVDESTIEYDMQDYGDLIAPISDAKFIDGTDLTPEQQEELESSTWYAEWVMTDYNNSRVESAEQPVEEETATEGNEFAQAVNKAKAAGMKPGDKFTVGDKEYTLKDAIEQAGMQLETFFNENSDDYEGSFEYEFTGDDGEMAWGKIHYKAVNGQVDPNSLQGESEYEGNAKVDDEYATYVIQPGGDEHDEALLAAQEDYDEIAMKMQSKFEQPEAKHAEPTREHYKKAMASGFKGSYEDYKKEYASFPEEFPKNEAAADKEISEITRLAGI
jgi:hypothetical protein